MKNSMTLLCIILAVVIAFSAFGILPAGAFSVPYAGIAATGATVDQITGEYEYEFHEDGTAEITRYKGSSTELEIPSVLDGHTVTSIGYGAFSNCYRLTAVTIPDSVTNIDSRAFYGCSGLTSVIIGKSVTTIGSYAFSTCYSLANIMIPDSVASISSNALMDTMWFNNQPDGLVYAGKVAYAVKGTCPEEVIIKDGTVGLAERLFYSCNTLKSVTIPDSVTEIGDHAFYGCISLTSINIPNSVTKIRAYAFSYCTSLSAITIPDSVTSIGGWVFSDCESLISVKLSNSITRIDEGLFSRCKSLTSFTIPDSITLIGSNAFKLCKSLTSINIPESVTNIGSGVFYGCESLTSITIPDTVTWIGEKAFKNTAWYDNQPDGPVYAGRNLFTIKGDCPKEVVIKDGTLRLFREVFSGCDTLVSVTIPDSVKIIDTRAFYGCSSLADIRIPDSVTSIGLNAFMETPWFNNQPDGLVYAGKVAYAVKGTCPEEVIIKDGTIEIAERLFYNCYDLKYVTIPNTVTSIGLYAFLGCKSLMSITIPDSVTNISAGEFYACESLTSISIPDSVTVIDNCALGYTGDYYLIGDDFLYSEERIDDFTINGYTGTAAEKYANDNGFTFIALDEQGDILLGEVDGDGEVTIIDATYIQRRLASMPTESYNEKAADTDGDGEVTILDATAIQRWLAELPTEAKGIGEPIA